MPDIGVAWPDLNAPDETIAPAPEAPTEPAVEAASGEVAVPAAAAHTAATVSHRTAVTRRGTFERLDWRVTAPAPIRAASRAG